MSDDFDKAGADLNHYSLANGNPDDGSHIAAALRDEHIRALCWVLDSPDMLTHPLRERIYARLDELKARRGEKRP